MKEADSKALLFRGKEAQHYTFRISEGTWFAYSSEYSEGSIYYNGKLYTNIQVNLDSFRDDLCVKAGNGSMPIVINQANVSWFSMGEKRFASISDTDGMENGYYEVLSESKAGNTIYKKIRKLYDSRVEHYNFYAEESFYICKDFKFYHIRNLSDIKKLYKSEIGKVDISWEETKEGTFIKAFDKFEKELIKHRAGKDER